jgi:hypothetical protein
MLYFPLDFTHASKCRFRHILMSLKKGGSCDNNEDLKFVIK